MIPFAIALIAALPLGLLLLATLWSYRKGSLLQTAVLGMTVVHEFVLVAYPCWYSVYDGFEYERQIYVTPGKLLPVLCMEVGFVLLFLLPFVPGKQSRSLQATDGKHGRLERLVIYVLVVGMLVSYVFQLISPGYSYEAMASSSDIVVKSGLGASMIDWMDSFIRWPGVIASALVLMSAHLPRWLRMLGGLAVLLGFYLAVINGVRGGVLLIIELAVACAFLRNAKRMLLMGILCTIAVAPLMSWVHHVMRYETAAAAAAGVSRGEMLLIALRQVQDLGLTGMTNVESNSFLQSWADRAEGPRNSTGLVSLYDEGQGAGFKPIVNAFLMPIPRIWWPDKPVGGSTNSTNLGAAIYRVQQLKPNTAPTDMGPLLASAHAYWELGYGWILIAGLLTGFFWRMVLAWAATTKGIIGEIVVLSFMAALPIDGLFTALNPIYTFILIAYRLCPLFLLIWFIKMILASRKKALRGYPSSATTRAGDCSLG